MIKKYKKWKGLQHVFENNWLKLKKEGASRSENIRYVYSLYKVKEIVMTSICLLSLVMPLTF